MKKQLLSFISCALISTAINAQTNVFFDNFEGPAMEANTNWIVTEREGELHGTWHIINYQSPTGFSGQVAASYAESPITASLDHLMMSKPISLPSGNTFLSFKIATETPAGERYAVYILPANSVFQGTEVPILTEIATNNVAAITKSINIPNNLANQQVRLYFRHFQQGNIMLYIDDIKIATGTALGVSESTKPDVKISVYPNPVKNQLNIKSPEKILSTEVFDVTGRSMPIESDISKINVSKLGSGNYILKIKTEEGISIKKITKE